MHSQKPSEDQATINLVQCPRDILKRYERTKVLEVYFSRIDGRIPEIIPSDYLDLYSIELSAVKDFLLTQHPQDPILWKILKIMG